MLLPATATPPPVPKQALAGQSAARSAGVHGIEHTLLPSSKTRLVVRGSAEVVLKPERAKLLVAALATPNKRAKPKSGQKQGDANI